MSVGRALGPLVALVVGVVLAGCGCGDIGGRSDANGQVGGSRLCHLLEVPVGQLEEHDVTVEQLLTLEGRHGVGIRAGFAFLQVGRAPGAERFRPALGYLSERWEAESFRNEANPAPPSDAVVENARELDAFLADGGCG